MAEHNERGSFGEEEAVAYLREEGFLILDTNWSYGKDEVDIIARDGSFLVFLEVKTRTADTYGRPEEFVTKEKQKHLIRAANAYIEKKDLYWEIRFDIIAVTLQPRLKVDHLREAFHP